MLGPFGVIGSLLFVDDKNTEAHRELEDAAAAWPTIDCAKSFN
jgi:hypothetical protein